MINENNISDQNIEKRESAFLDSYKSFYGGHKNNELSSDCPVFHLLISTVSLIIVIIILWLGGSFGPAILTDRIDTFIWPWLNIIVLLAGFITITGFVTGPIGLVWYYFLKKKENNIEED